MKPEASWPPVIHHLFIILHYLFAAPVPAGGGVVPTPSPLPHSRLLGGAMHREWAGGYWGHRCDMEGQDPLYRFFLLCNSTMVAFIVHPSTTFFCSCSPSSTAAVWGQRVPGHHGRCVGFQHPDQGLDTACGVRQPSGGEGDAQCKHGGASYHAGVRWACCGRQVGVLERGKGWNCLRAWF